MKLAAAPLLVLAACTTATAEQPAASPGQAAASPVRPDVTSSGCDAPLARGLIGQQATAELGTRALKLTGTQRLRWIRPGEMVTMDYREDRLTIELDEAGRVRGIRCG
jgi:hypothetical protein